VRSYFKTLAFSVPKTAPSHRRERSRACASRESIDRDSAALDQSPPYSIGRSRARNDHLAYRASRDGRWSAACGVLLPANGRISALRGRKRVPWCVCGVRGNQLADPSAAPRLATRRTSRRSGPKSDAIAPRRSVGRSIGRTDDPPGRGGADNRETRARRGIEESHRVPSLARALTAMRKVLANISRLCVRPRSRAGA